MEVLSAAGIILPNHCLAPEPPDPYCGSEPAAAADDSENARSVGVLITYGKFRFLDLGDLTKQKEMELACPNNLLGTVDLFLGDPIMGQIFQIPKISTLGAASPAWPSSTMDHARELVLPPGNCPRLSRAGRSVAASLCRGVGQSS